MPDPVIIDDGGSTRIKKLLKVVGGGGATNDLDDLMIVDTIVAPGKPYDGFPGSAVQIKARGPAPARYGTLSITYIDALGVGFNSAPIPIAANFLVNSGRFKIAGELVAGANRTDLMLTVYSDAGSEPFVDARQHRQQRRFIVSNAPPIDQVQVDGRIVYDATAPAFGAPSMPVTYSSLTVS